MIGAAASAAISVLLSTGGYLTFGTVSGSTVRSFTTMFLIIVLGSELIGFALLVVSFGFFRQGFVDLRPVDPRFTSSPTWALLAMVGLAVVAPALTIILVGVFRLASCAGTTAPIPPTCIDFGTLLGGAALLLIGGILALIGFIGTLVAIWRLGDRYGESLFKIGAVLLIFPFLSIVGQILIYVGARGVTSRLSQPPSTGFAPSIPASPPPLR